MCEPGSHRRPYRGVIDFGSFDTVKINISSFLSRDEFTIDRKVVCRSSGLLKKIFSSGQGNELATTLPNIDSMHFNMYLNWLHTDVLPTNVTESQEQDGMEDEYDLLINGYLVGSKLEDRKYCNATISAMFEKAQEDREQGKVALPSGDLIADIVFTGDRPADMVILYNAILEIFARSSKQEDLHSEIKSTSLDQDFVGDLAWKLFEYRDKMPDLRVCDFHRHEDEGGDMQEPAKKRNRQE